MAFNSSTKSWAICSKDQKRECMAFAVFNKLAGLPAKVDSFVADMKIKFPEQNISGIKDVEKIFSLIEKSLVLPKIDPLKSADTIFLLKNGDLSGLVKAINGFKWTGSSKGTPIGKSESTVGISDSLLDRLMSSTGASDLLSSWLSAGDSSWRRWVDSEIESRKNEIHRLKYVNPKDNKIAVLEQEIKRLEQDWKL